MTRSKVSPARFWSIENRMNARNVAQTIIWKNIEPAKIVRKLLLTLQKKEKSSISNKI